MTKNILNIFNYSSLKAYLNDYLKESPRGTQARMARAIGCQATYLIKVLKDSANLTEDQAFHAGRFLKLTGQRFDYFLDLARLDRAGNPEARKYLEGKIKIIAEGSQQLKTRVSGNSVENSLLVQAEYFSNWKYSTVHLATSCKDYQTPESIARKFKLDVAEVIQVLSFLEENGFVTQSKPNVYLYGGKSIHLSKESPFHRIFQKVRREAVLRILESGARPQSVHFSAAFATTPKRIKALKEKFLNLIEQTNAEIEADEPEDLALLVVDFTPL